MKNFFRLFFGAFLLLASNGILAQTLSTETSARSDALVWEAKARTECSTLKESTVLTTNAATGTVATNVHRFVQVGTGLNYLDESGQWQPSQDLIELMSDGTAAAIHAPTKFYFNPNLNTPGGAITMVTSTKATFKTSVLGLYYFDPVSGKSVQISAVRDCAAELHPPNRLVYKSALSCGDIRVTCTRAATETDFILTQKPKPPESFGLSPYSRLELWHEWFNAPLPQRKPKVLRSVTDPQLRATMVEPDLIDEILNFPELWLPQGVAFSTGNETTSDSGTPWKITVPSQTGRADTVPVGKRWIVTPDRRQIMIESVNWSDIQPLASALPEMAQAPNRAKSKSRMLALQQLPSRKPARPQAQPIKMAKAPYAPKGVNFDYITISGSGDYTFESGNTYYLDSSAYFVGTITFQTNSTLKWNGDSYMLVYGTVTCPDSDSNSPPSIILTSKNDDLFGDPIDGSSHSPSAAGCPIHVYFGNGNLKGMRIRWAGEGVNFEYSYGSVENCSFELCQTGINGSQASDTVTIDSSTQCGVATPLIGDTWNFSGSLTDVCSGDADSDGLPDVWEMRWFGDFNQSGTGDPDSDGVDNLGEYLRGRNPTAAGTVADSSNLINLQVFTPLK